MLTQERIVARWRGVLCQAHSLGERGEDEVRARCVGGGTLAHAAGDSTGRRQTSPPCDVESGLASSPSTSAGPSAGSFAAGAGAAGGAAGGAATRGGAAGARFAFCLAGLARGIGGLIAKSKSLW